MINELLNHGINKDTIEYIKDNDILEADLLSNFIDCKEIIDYLRDLGINNIDELLLYIPNLFMKTKDYIEKLFNKKNIENMVNQINEDCTNIDLLFE